MRANPHRTLESIVIGVSNRYAVEMVVGALERNTRRPRLVVILGETGVGKTLLLHAAANEYTRLYTTRTRVADADDLAASFIEAIGFARVHAFRSSLVRSNALFVDGCEDLSGRPTLVAELFRRADQIVERGGVVMFAGLPCAREILAPSLEHRDVTWTEIDRPTLDEREAALLPHVDARALSRRTHTIAEAKAKLLNDEWRATSETRRALC